MKKIIALLSAAILSLGCLALTACGPKDPGTTPPPSMNVELEQKRMGADIYYVVIGVSDSTVKDVFIPNSFNGHPITAIEAYAFDGLDIDSVTIGANVTMIDGYAFGDYHGAPITIPSNVTEINGAAFYGMTTDTLIFETTSNWGYIKAGSPIPLNPFENVNFASASAVATLFTTAPAVGWTPANGEPTGVMDHAITLQQMEL